MVDRPVGDRDIERVRLRFHARTGLGLVPVALTNSRTAQVRVSTPEATVLDLVSRPLDSGGLSNVATVVGELAEDKRLDPARLAEVAALYPLAVVRRLGWLFDQLIGYAETADLADPLHDLVAGQSVAGRRAVDLVQPGGSRRGSTNQRWGLVENAEVEPDL